VLIRRQAWYELRLSWKLLSLKGAVRFIKEVKVVDESSKVLIFIRSGGEQSRFELIVDSASN
jgi:hypothetical protein